MVSVSSLGIGSGLDLSNLVDGLVEAQRAPAESRFNTKEAAFTSELSAFGLLRGALSGFQSSLAGLRTSGSFNTLSANSSNSDIISVDSSDTADELSASVEVNQLAKANTLASVAFDSVDSAIGEGTLSITFGTTDYDAGTDTYNSFTQNSAKAVQVITVSAAEGNNTVSGLRDFINDGDFGVSASIVNDGTGYRLLLRSDSTGAENSLSISVADSGDGNDTDAAGLSSLAFNASATNLQQTIAAQDAEVVIDGLTVTSDTNSLDEAIQGVTLNLLKAEPGTAVSVSVSASSAAAEANIQSFVDAYNDTISTVNDLSRFDAATNTAGALIGDAAIRSIQTRLRAVFTSPVEALSGSVRALVDIGITTNNNGTLSLDTSKLNAALDEDPQAVAALFATQGRPTDSQIVFDNAGAGTQAGNYAVSLSAVATRGTIQGGGVLPADFSNTPLIIDGDNDSFTIKVDGITSSTINITQGSYDSGDTLAAVIQAQINNDQTLKDNGSSVLVTYDSTTNRFELSSSRYGSESSIELLTVDTNSAAELGLAVGAGTDGTDVAGTINGFAATGNGQLLTSIGGPSEGLALRIVDGASGDRGSVSYSTGFVAELDALISQYLASDGLLDAREEGLKSSIDEITEQREDLNLRLQSFESRLLAQYAALDTLLAQFQSTENFLRQQLGNLPGARANNDN